MRVSVIAPVLDEAPWIGYSILSCLEQVHQFIYALDAATSDGTRELLSHIKDRYAHEKLVVLDQPNFHPSDTKAYNGAFNRCIEASTGDACWFYHPDMLVTKWADLEDGPLAWTTKVTSYAGDLQTVITQGRGNQWKNIHAKKFGLSYFGGYGSQNEDFYHPEITGNSHRHYGEEFSKYPFLVEASGIEVNHYCEVKSYKRRLEKMKLCLKTQNPGGTEGWLAEAAANHPRVHLQSGRSPFGEFQFTGTGQPIPEVILKYKEEFSQFLKEPCLV